MCLLVYMSEYTTASPERLFNASINNPDGFGWAIVEKHKIIKGHGMNFDQVLDDFLDARKKHHGDALFHLRWTTHGVTDVTNCHPFTVGDDNLSVIAHNGILPIDVPKEETRSDTRIFAEDWLPQFGGVPALDDKDFFDDIERFTRGSKLVVLTANPDTKYWSYIVNEGDGYWDDGVWWSNKSYEVRTTPKWGGWASPYFCESSGIYVTADEADIFNEDGIGTWRCGTCSNAIEVDFSDPTWDGLCTLCGVCMYCDEYDCECYSQDTPF